MKVTSIKANKGSPLVKSITASPTTPDGHRVRFNPFKSAFQLLVLDIKRSVHFADARKSLDDVLVRLDTMRRDGHISPIQYHTALVVWHQTLIELLKRSA